MQKNWKLTHPTIPYGEVRPEPEWQRGLAVTVQKASEKMLTPRPAAVFVNYTGLSEVYGNEPPTYSAVGTNDGIASYRTIERRINAIRANGTDAEIEVFNGLSHGFGLGTGTVAEGWIDRAVEFWERNMKNAGILLGMRIRIFCRTRP